MSARISLRSVRVHEREEDAVGADAGVQREHLAQVLRQRVRARREVGVPAAHPRQPLRVVELLLALGRERLLLVALGDGALALDRGHQQVRDRLDEGEVVLGERVAPAAARHQLAERRRLPTRSARRRG